MVEMDGLPVLLINNFYDDDENSNRRKELWSLDVTCVYHIIYYIILLLSLLLLYVRTYRRNIFYAPFYLRTDIS